MGLDFEVLDSGCCGLAGSFGFEAEHHDVSVAIAESRLLPMVRAAAADTLVIGDGFSCKTQVEQLSDRRPLHTAQVLKMALEHGPEGVPGPLPERAAGTRPPSVAGNVGADRPPHRGGRFRARPGLRRKRGLTPTVTAATGEECLSHRGFRGRFAIPATRLRSVVVGGTGLRGM